MCLHKRLIKNRVASYKRGFYDKYMISVQCNNCPECRKAKQNDWLVRSYYEIQCNDYKSKFFVTLDFDNQHLPVYNGIACFDSEVIKSFFKRLRYYTGSFRYLYSTDYGSALQRPHYHVMFLFKDYIDQYQFYDYVRMTWLCGSYSRIDLLRSGSDIWNCVSYVCKYTVKDITFNFAGREKELPIRYRSRSQASSKFGYSALEEGFITWDMLKNNVPVYIPCGKNGKLYPFSIPRYYELKITQYSVYYPHFRRSEWFKNELGRELEQIRHNANYIYLLDCMVSSLDVSVHRMDCYNVWKDLYPSSPYIGMSWQYMLSDVLSNSEDFINFLSVSPFLKRSRSYKLQSAYGKYIDTRYIDDWTEHLIDNPNFELYNQVLHLFKLYKDEIDYSKFLVESYSSVVESKKRLYNKILNSPKLRMYLDKVGFDYSTLFDVDVLQFTDSFKDSVTKLDTFIPVHRYVDPRFSYYKINLYSNCV